MGDRRLNAIQQALTDLGYDLGPVDGLFGPRTKAALLSLVASGGLPASQPSISATPPWVAELLRRKGLHEVNDKTSLMQWLRSDGRTLGDPSKLPWCGDAVETAIKLTLPGEVFPAVLQQNPYWAKNWAFFGKEVTLQQHAVGVFSRAGGGGHVAFIMGRDPATGNLVVLGGNQKNMVSFSLISPMNLIGVRWPLSYPAPQKAWLPDMKVDGKPLSSGEMA